MTMVRAGYPLYLQLKALLLEKIDSGEWPEGTMIPTEQDLIASHGVSRTTVRQALSDLVVSGKLIRQPGRGTFVAKQEQVLTSSPLYGFAEEFELLGRQVDFTEHTISVVKADLTVATNLRIAVDSPVIRIGRTANIDDRPAFCDESYLPEEMGSFFSLAADAPPHIYSLLESCGIHIAAGEQSIGAETASEHFAAILQCAVGDPLLLVERLTRDVGGRPVEYAIARYRADSYQYRVRLRRAVTEQ